jgi:hypothetical protein
MPITATRIRGRSRKPAGQEATRLAAIRAIVDLAGDDEDHDVAADALLILGASHQEISAATLGPPR